MGGNEEKYIREAFETNWITSLGPNVDAFESGLEHFLQNRDKYVVALSSGTAAVHLGLLLLGVGPGDEVLCQSWTFAASVNPVAYLGARPVFVDSEADTWNMSPALLEKAIEERLALTGKKPKAIVAVDLYGMPARWDEIKAISQRYGIPVLEDSAEAMGSVYKGALCGTFGDFGVLSFNGNKMITTGAGGALICPTKALKEKSLYYATQAREPLPYYQHENIGYNYRLSNISAAIGRGQMEVVDEHIAHHRKLTDAYIALLNDVDGITVHKNPSPDYSSNYWLTTILINEETTGVDAEKMRLHLAAENIESRPLWKPMHRQPVFESAPRYLCGVSDTLWAKGLCLPCGPMVAEKDVERIVSEIKKCIKEGGRHD